jgi:NAD(P)-dependent dehydrogenase (short-subunit alcohol dehydrogenase family)
MGDRVKGKVAIVTGAGSAGPGVGNGKASAIVYAREGASVMVVDNRISAAKETEKMIKEEGGNCITFEADMSKSGDCKNMIERCIEIYGKIDILHNNVGIALFGGPVELSEEDWDRAVSVNLKSMFLTCKYALPYMEKVGAGSIINISSIAGIRAMPVPAISYETTKAGIIGLTRDIAIQYASKGIRANTILPGYLRTPMIEASVQQAYGKDIEDAHRKRDAMCPTGHQGEAWDVAYMALYLASDEAKYVTASNFVVDGGITQTHRLWPV